MRLPGLFAAALCVWLPFDAAAAPKPAEPARVIKPEAGYFDEAFALEPGGRRLAAIRTDGATFAKLEIFDIPRGKAPEPAAGKGHADASAGGAPPAQPAAAFDLPGQVLAVDQLIPLGEGQGVVVVARQGAGELQPLMASLIDAAGHVVAHAGPAKAFGRAVAARGVGRTSPQPLLVAFDRKLGDHGAVTYTVTPYVLATLAPAGRPRVYPADGAGMLKAPPVRILGFFDGFTRALAERPGVYDKKTDVRTAPRMVVLDTLSGKIAEESEIGDVMAWVAAGRLRAAHPDHGQFVALNEDQSGVDIVDVMGKKQPAALAVPFRLYDPKSLRDQEGEGPGALYFSLGVDPVNPDAVKRQKADLPVLDLYSVEGPEKTATLRARVFTPRPVLWTTGSDRLVVLKRWKSFARGGDELQVYDLR
jgi:hypothetical protein